MFVISIYDLSVCIVCGLLFDTPDSRRYFRQRAEHARTFVLVLFIRMIFTDDFGLSPECGAVRCFLDPFDPVCSLVYALNLWTSARPAHCRADLDETNLRVVAGVSGRLGACIVYTHKQLYKHFYGTIF